VRGALEIAQRAFHFLKENDHMPPLALGQQQFIAG
jgi:hypothetical protein